MLTIKKHIPNFFTLMNIVCGFVAITYALQSEFLMAFYWIIGAAFFDFIDGAVARLLKVQSEIGKQLDSLCDVVSFGVAPGMIAFMMMMQLRSLAFPLEGVTFVDLLFLLSPLFIPAFSALRLAKFNVDTRQSDRFIGLPVPANALLIASLAALTAQESAPWLVTWLSKAPLWAFISLVLSYLLVSPLPMFALKFKNLKWKGNALRFIFLIISALLLVFWGLAGVALAIVLYILLSLIVSLLKA